MTHAMDGASVLVTGGAGFIGSHLADRLVAVGASVRVLDDLSAGSRADVPSEAEFVEASITDRAAVRESVTDTDLVFHLAADARTKETALGWDEPLHDLEVNSLGTLALLQTLREVNRTARTVIASSAAVYGPPRAVPIGENHPTFPVSPYGVSKLSSEKYGHAFAEVHGMRVSSARIFNTYGPRQSRYVMYDLIRKAMDEPTTIDLIGSGKQVRDYCYVDDTVEALLAIARSDSNDVYNICASTPTTVMEVAEQVRDLVAPNAEIVTSSSSWPGDIPTLLGDPSKLMALGWEPTVDVKDGLRRLVDWVTASTEGA